MKYETISTHDIRQGDLIADHGMLLRVDSEPFQTSHPRNEYSPTLAVRALIENWDEMVTRAATDRTVAGFIVGLVRDDLRTGRVSEPRWTIQGNGLARWERVREEVAK